jgi:predicted  nucleic acid-binding Zn-ribbon protein
MTRKFESLASKVCDEVATASAAGDLRAARQAVEFALETAHSAGVTKLLNENKLAWSQRDHACAEVAMLRRELNDRLRGEVERKTLTDAVDEAQTEAERLRRELSAAQDEIAATAARLAEVTQDLEGQRKHSQFLEGQLSVLRIDYKTLNADRKEMIDAVIDALGDDLCCLGDVVASIRALRREVQTHKSAVENLQANYGRACKETQEAQRQRDQESARLREFQGFARAIGSIAGILGSRAALEPSGAVEAVAKLFTDARALRANRDALARDLQAVGDALGGDILFSGDVPASVRLLRERLSSEGVQRLINENARLKREIDDARDRLAQVTQIACLAPVSRKSGGDMDA